ncbi:flagellar hook-length control protein FliK [Aeribacillus pallidus]|nr:flagellar hook-length control protein FliK [Aeribacillus pallidus]
MDAVKLQLFQLNTQNIRSTNGEEKKEESTFQTFFEQLVDMKPIEQMNENEQQKFEIETTILQELENAIKNLLPHDILHDQEIDAQDKQEGEDNSLSSVSIPSSENLELTFASNMALNAEHTEQSPEKTVLFQQIAAVLAYLQRNEPNEFIRMLEVFETITRKYGDLGSTMLQNILTAVQIGRYENHSATIADILPNDLETSEPLHFIQQMDTNKKPLVQREEILARTHPLMEFVQQESGAEQKSVGNFLTSQTKDTFELTLTSYINKFGAEHSTPKIDPELPIDVREEFIQKLKEAFKTSRFGQLPNGAQKLTIRLTPEHLGTITIQLIKDGDQMSAKIMTSTQSAKELLEHSIQQLKHSLPNITFQIDRFDIFDEEHYFFQEKRGREHSQHNGEDQEKHQNQQQNDQTFMEKLKEYVNAII